MFSENVDSETAAVVGAGLILEKLRPDRGDSVRLNGYGADDGEAWQVELDRLQEAEMWSANAEALRTVRNALSEMPELDRVATRLRSDVLDDAELFVCKRFFYWARASVQEARDLLVGWGFDPGWDDQLGELMQSIHPEPKTTARFRLSSELEPRLRAARAKHKSARNNLRDVRQAAEAAVVEALGGAFDIRGGFVTEEHSASELESHGLELVDGRWRPNDAALQAARDQLSCAEETVDALQAELRERLSQVLRNELDWLVEVDEFMTILDVRLTKVRLKSAMDGCWPHRTDRVALEGGQDPRLVARLGTETQAIDVEITPGATVVTGPNMGGKSALLRLVGLAIWCAQHALPVPARSAGVVLFDGLVYIGSEAIDGVDAVEGLSSFGREVRRFVRARESAGESNWFWLLDEFGRGTHPTDGAELACDVVRDLLRAGHTVMAATHFPALAQLQDAAHLRIRGLIDGAALEAAISQARDDSELRDALQEGMDYRPAVVTTDDVPRDARIVARALGLTFAKDSDD